MVSVYGQPLSLPLTHEPGDTKSLNAFRFVMRSWFPPVLDVIYERYYLLEITVREVIEDMGKVSG